MMCKLGHKEIESNAVEISRLTSGGAVDNATVTGLG